MSGKIVVDAAIAVQRALGPILLENETRHYQCRKQSGGIILASLRLGARHYED
jgi:hypothetical protein